MVRVWDGYFEHPKHMLKLMGKKIFTIYINICLPKRIIVRAEINIYILGLNPF